MDQLPSLGTAIADVVHKTLAIYEPQLVANATSIRSTHRKTFSYGSHPRQALDVYYPPSSRSEEDSTNSPVLIFLYGGGLVRGDKTLPGNYADGLVHANVGHFFAANYHYTVVVPDYRLISHGAVFPSGGEDVALTVNWVRDNLLGPGNGRELYMMGNSAGGIHLSTYLFSPVFAESRSKAVLSDRSDTTLRLRGVVMLSVPFDFSAASPNRAEILKAYYGTRTEEDCPLGLLKTARQNREAGLGDEGISMLVLNGTLDPQDEILDPKRRFVEEWNRTVDPSARKLLSVEVMVGQNHISPPLSLGTARSDEEAWGRQVGAWIESIRATHG